jgi:hypothetical protein
MAKTTAPLLSFDASGQIAKSMVASKWKGRQYMRRHVVPANPQTTAQMQTRDMFSFLNNIWRQLPALVTDPWTLMVQGQVQTNRNAFIAANIKAMRNAGGAPDATLAHFIFSNGAKSGPPPVSILVTPGATQLTVNLNAPTSAPTGWTLTAMVAAAIRDQDPTSGALFKVTAGQDLTATYDIVLTGLTTGQLYRVGGWAKWTKPDGSLAYSAQLQGSGTPT